MAVYSSVNGTTAIPWRGSTKKRLSLLEQLAGCQDAWCPPSPWDRDRAHAALRGTPAGSFLIVQDSATSQPSLLCVSAGPEAEDVLDYNVKRTGEAFNLSESRLSFSDLAQLALFYSLTRDVLTVCLSIPRWIYSITEKSRDRLTQLEPKTWLSTPADRPADDDMTHREPSDFMCSIQLTSTSGALCVVNPLYIHEHGDEWLTQRIKAVQCTAKPSGNKRPQRLSSTRKWDGAGLQSKRAISLDQEPSAASAESSGLIRVHSADSPQCRTPSTTAAAAGVVLRRPSREAISILPQRWSIDSLSESSPSSPEGPSSLALELKRHSGPGPVSPHRVSWIEDGFWLPPPRPSARPYLPSLELDSLSISSIEEEQEMQTLSSNLHYPCAQRLAHKVKHRLSAVGQVLSGLVSQKKRLTNRVHEMSERKHEPFAEAVRAFVETTLRKGADPGKVTASEFLQEVRSSLTLLREPLWDCQEILAVLDSMTDLTDSEIDTLVELSLQKVALKPVSAHLYSCIHASRTANGTLQSLQSNMSLLEKRGIEELGGSAGVGAPNSVIMERIQHKWTSVHEAYSPNKKVQILLKVCKSIYHSMSANSTSGTVFGADDFLPCLTWVLLRSDVVTLQIDTDYMMELLDPTQLQGEGGYYLTTLYAALYYISSFQPRLAARQLSVEAQESLNRWHRRRTLHCNQSRRSKTRRTIRRHVSREVVARIPENNSGIEEESCERTTKEEVRSQVESSRQFSEMETGNTEEDGADTCKKETESSEGSVREWDPVGNNDHETQQQAKGSTEALQQSEGETSNKHGAENKSQKSSPTLDCDQQDIKRNKQKEGQSACAAGEMELKGF